LYAASGLLFPLPAAVLVNLMGTVIMVSIPYSVGAANGAEMLENLFRKHPRAAMLKSLRAGSDFFFALLVRLLGVLPGDLVGAYMGASGVKYPAYLAGTVLGMLPSMITFPLMGMNIRRVGSPEFLISAGIQVAMSILSVILYFVLRKKNREEKGTEYEEN
ncbi:MAG: VTT domain-containing protein, partial [Clostridiales bacterium]|nr:VTT domain-containing protein [Clostridiales bacterium]